MNFSGNEELDLQMGLPKLNSVVFSRDLGSKILEGGESSSGALDWGFGRATYAQQLFSCVYERTTTQLD